VGLVDHNALAAGDGADGAERAVARVPEAEAEAGAMAMAIYRGWMLRAEQYAAFERALAGRGVTLRTSAAQYRRAHEFPGWYEALNVVTPRSVWTSGTDRVAFDTARAELGPGPAVLRDYVKSMKHYWHQAAFIPDLADAEGAWAVASRFLELREDDLVGGFVLRRYESFASAEVRTWWLDGICRLVGPHPDTPDDLPPAEVDLTPIEPLVAGFGLPFVTVDLARRADGVWRVIELGDAQVSDRPSTAPSETLIAMLTTKPPRRT
jgi:ATP-grasp domain-containing protein